MSFLAAAGSIAAAEALAAAAMAGTTAAQVAAAAVAAQAAAAATAAGATAIAVPTLTTTLPAAFGAAGSSLGATGTGLTVGSGLGATGVGGAGLGTTGLTVGSGLGASGGAGLGGLGASAGAGGLGTLGTMALPAAGGIGEILATTAVPALAEQGFSQATKETAKTAGKEVAGASKEKLTAGNERFLRNSVAGEIPTGGMTVAPAPAPSNLVSVTPPKPSPLPQASPRAGSTFVRPADAVKAPTPKSSAYMAEPVLQPSPMNAGRGGLGSVETSLSPKVTNLTNPVNEAGTDLMMKSIADSTVHRTPLQKAGDFVMDNKMELALGGLGLAQMMPPSSGVNPISETMIRPYTYSEEDTSDQEADPSGREKIRYSSSYAAGTPYKAAQGGLLSLHRGGNFLSGRGDGMSDDIPAMIGTKQPARLADGEFVIPADVVSHIGNGSSKAGAEKLYAMMDKIRQERTGRKRQSPQINAAKYLPR